MTRKELISEIRDIVQSYDLDDVYNELRGWVNDNITISNLKKTLITIIDQCEADYDDEDMILAVLESEIESYFKFKEIIK